MWYAAAAAAANAPAITAAPKTLPGTPMLPETVQRMPMNDTSVTTERSKPSEIDHINGHVVREGEALGIPTPVNRLLHALVKLRDRAGA